MTRLAAGWNRFWFAPQPTGTLALVRIAFGFVSLAWGLSLVPDLLTFFSGEGLLPRQPPGQGPALWTVLGLFKSDAAVVVLLGALLAASVALIVGWWTRLAALVVFVALVSFDRRNPFVLNSGDGLLKIIALYLALAPSGASLSLDRLRLARDRFWEFPKRAPWALRLLQIQVSVIYISTIWQKARGTTWNDGTAVSYVFRLKDLERFPMPSSVTHSITLSNLATYGTLAIEFSLGVLVWNRVLRPWVLAAGVALHLGIDYSIRVGFFSYAIFVLYVAFIPPNTATRLILAVRDRVSRMRMPASAQRVVPGGHGQQA